MVHPDRAMVPPQRVSLSAGEREPHGIAQDRDSPGASLVAQSVKNLPAMQETRVQCLGQEDLLRKVMATHSSILA